MEGRTNILRVVFAKLRRSKMLDRIQNAQSLREGSGEYSTDIMAVEEKVAAAEQSEKGKRTRRRSVQLESMPLPSLQDFSGLTIAQEHPTQQEPERLLQPSNLPRPQHRA